jgi:hypothetical protein
MDEVKKNVNPLEWGLLFWAAPSDNEIIEVRQVQ